MSKINPDKISAVIELIKAIDVMSTRHLIIACCEAMVYDVDAENLKDYIEALIKDEKVMCSLIRKIVKDDTGLEDEITRAFDRIDAAFFRFTQDEETKKEPHLHNVSCGL